MVVPDVSDISHTAVAVLAADAAAVPNPDTASVTAAVPKTARHLAGRCIDSPPGQDPRLRNRSGEPGKRWWGQVHRGSGPAATAAAPHPVCRTSWSLPASGARGQPRCDDGSVDRADIAAAAERISGRVRR